jgi:16S rRNA (cytidine1402-2'-O)-methyltransferase
MSEAENRELAPGLYLVGTPIGNLEDMTLRAIRVLKQADIIACEDTRQTQKLLNHFGIETRATSYHEHNEASRAAELVETLVRGGRVAVVSDAGMPGISDPGFRLVWLAIEILGSEATQAYYEAPHRIKETLADIVEVLGAERPVVVARELTKIHEEFLRGRAGVVAQTLNARSEVKGEITLLIGKAAEGASAPRRVSVRARVEEIVRVEKVDEKAALKKVAKERGISKSEAYREWQRT